MNPALLGCWLSVVFHVKITFHMKVQAIWSFMPVERLMGIVLPLVESALDLRQ